MKEILFSIAFLFSCSCLFAQELDTIPEPAIINIDKLNKPQKAPLANRTKKTEKVVVDPESGKANWLDYKIITHDQDTILVDTTLTIQKDYKMNYLRKDLFGYHTFQNQGQVLTKLTYDHNDGAITPRMGAIGKHDNYAEIEDQEYYFVPTPSSEFLYRNGIEQGQVLDSRLAINMTERFNFSIGYKGLRSLGAFRNSLSSVKSFRGTVSYKTKNDRYHMRFHWTDQNILNQENGGLTEIAQEFFETNHPDYSDRGRLDVNLEDANSSLIGKRYYLDHNFKLFKSKERPGSKLSDIKLGHTFVYETKRYYFRASATDFYGDTFTSETDDKSSYKAMTNLAYLNFSSPYILGNFKVTAGYHYYYLGYKKVVYTDAGTIPNQIKQDAISIGADWNANIKNIHFTANASTILAGDITGSNLFVEAAFKKRKTIEIATSLQLNSKAANINYNFNQSNFIEYNWFNEFKNIDTRNLNFKIDSKWGSAEATVSQIDNYLFFNEDQTQASPTQYDKTINSFKIQGYKEFKFGNFALDNAIIYQSVVDGASVYKIPDLIVRSTFYYSKLLFKKKSLYLQTGVTGNYFTAYQANMYNPILGEFTLQTTDEIGGKPLLDAFINAQIRRTRIYLKAENLLSLTNNNYYYSTPNKPYKDFVFRFGFVWNFFK